MQIINLTKSEENSKLIDLLIAKLKEVGISSIRCYFEGKWQLEVPMVQAERALGVVEENVAK